MGVPCIGILLPARVSRHFRNPHNECKSATVFKTLWDLGPNLACPTNRLRNVLLAAFLEVTQPRIDPGNKLIPTESQGVLVILAVMHGDTPPRQIAVQTERDLSRYSGMVRMDRREIHPFRDYGAVADNFD